MKQIKELTANYAIKPTPEQALGSNRTQPRARLIAALDLTMRISLIAVGLLIVANALDSNECRYDLLSDQTVQDAKFVSIVRIDALDVDRDTSSHLDQGALKGQFTVVESLRGGLQSASFRYDGASCCGIRLDVGHYYAVFFSVAAEEGLLSQENVLHIGEPGQIDRRKAGQLRRVVKGEFPLEGAFGENPSKALMPLGCATSL